MICKANLYEYHFYTPTVGFRMNMQSKTTLSIQDIMVKTPSRSGVGFQPSNHQTMSSSVRNPSKGLKGIEKD